MINLLYTFLLAIWFSILFYGSKLGLSVFLFAIPLLWIIYITLKKNDKIKNKKGLLLIIPIFLLSITYFLFDNLFFKILNGFVITFLFLLLYIMTIRPTFNILDIIADGVCILLNPIDNIKEITSSISKKISTKIKLKEQTKQKIKSCIIILPIIIIVLILLSSADMVFNNLIINIIKFPKQIINDLNLKNIIIRILLIITFFFYFSATLYYLLTNYQKEIREEAKSKKKKTDTIKILLLVLNIIYFIFDIIQIKSLLLHSVGETISYAEYAREGFFQLLIVSIINLCVILYSKKYDNKKDNKIIKILLIFLVVSTFIIIISSFIRMYMYEQEFGFTLLRLLVYISLITEVVCLIPTIIYIVKDKFNIVKYYLMIIITIYTLINYINIDKLIAIRNIDRYHKKKDIDIYYLMNNHSDNIPELVDFLKEVKDKDTKWVLREYLKNQNFKTTDFRDWNLSKQKAQKKLEERF